MSRSQAFFVYEN